MGAKNNRSENGQIIILLSLGIVALLAFTALAIDAGAIYFDRRSAQNAADAAALAGAYELAHDPWNTDTLAARIQTAAAGRAHDNHYGTADGKIVTISYPPEAASLQFVTIAGVVDSDVNNYVRVTITSTVSTSLLHFIFPGAVRDSVVAVAHVVLPTHRNPFSGSGLVSLAPHACARLYLGGNVNANLIGGGIFVNSDNSGCAADGGSQAFFLYTPSMNVVGGISQKLSGSSGLVVNPGPVQSPNLQAAIVYPPKSLGIPAVPTCSAAAQKNGTTVVDGITYDNWEPGSINGFPSGNIYFQSGIFCITINKNGNGGSINNNQHLSNAPGGVLLVFTGTAPCNVTINGGATLKLSGYTADPYQGLLIYVDPLNWSPATSGAGEGPLIFNGTQDSFIKGTVYAPTCSVKMNGTGGNFYQGQMIGFDVTMLGGAAINLIFVEDDNLVAQNSAQVDLTQ